MANRYTLADIPTLAGRKVFLDTNILVYLFWPTGNNWATNNYPKYFYRLLKQGIPLFVAFIVISEFINRAIRLEYDKYVTVYGLNKRTFTYKQYRDTDDVREAMYDIDTVVTDEVLTKVAVCGKEFLIQDIHDLLVVDSMDFTDRAIQKICQENNFVILTNDSDYAGCDFDVLTANRKILN